MSRLGWGAGKDHFSMGYKLAAFLLELVVLCAGSLGASLNPLCATTSQRPPNPGL